MPRIVCELPRCSVPSTRPLLALILPSTSPKYSSGTTTSTFIIGSSSVQAAFSKAALMPMEPAILNAISEESTS